MKKIKINNPEKWKQFILSEARYVIPSECNGGICIDAGCNIGDFPINQGKRFDKYVCIDVFQENIDEAINNTSDIGLNIDFIKKAVWSKSNEKINVMAYNRSNPDDLDHFGNSGNVGCIENIGAGGEGHRKENTIDIVETISLEELIQIYGSIALLKIDVEGSEYEFLLGKDLSKIEYIVGEFHYGIEKIDELVKHISKTHKLVKKGGNHIFTFKKM